MGLTIGIDVGGTKVAAGVVDEQGQIIARTRRWTPSLSPDKTEDVIADVVRELTAMHVVDAVGLGAAGFIDLSRSTVLFAPNLAWRDEPLRSDVEGRIGMPVVVENDGNCAAWAEYRYGAGRGVDDLAVVCLGTGIGGGFVFHGKLYRGGFGIAGEFGHVNVVPGGHPCGCGNFGCWEQYASGNALVRKARQLASRDRLAARKLLSLGDASPDGITGVHVTQAARDGDPVALGRVRRHRGLARSGTGRHRRPSGPGHVRHRRRGLRGRRALAHARSQRVCGRAHRRRIPAARADRARRAGERRGGGRRGGPGAVGGLTTVRRWRAQTTVFGPFAS